MRPFETYVGVACLVAILWPALFGVRPRRGVVSAILLGLLIAQWQIEGFRWPLLGLYVLAVGLSVGDIITIEREIPWARRLGRALSGSLGLIVVAAPAVLFPVPELPVPSGPLSIGTTTVELRHAELRESYGPRPGPMRRIQTQVWYPAHAPTDARPVPWVEDIDLVGSALAGRHGLPGFFFNSARYTKTHAYADAPIDEGGFPLIIFSHDWEGFRSGALGQVENLVSQGYVVIGIDHTYAAVATTLGGEAHLLDPEALGAEDATDAARMEAEAELIGTMAADVTHVMDEVEAGSEGAFGDLAEAIDETSIGLWGHGMGGGAVIEVCLSDERCDAVAGQDSRVENLPDEVLANTAVRPMLLMRSDPWRGTPNDAVLRGIVARSEAITYWVDVRGADTSDFLATPIVSPAMSRLGLRGPIDGNRVMIINRRFLTGFFDRFLLGTGTAALDTADFAEVDVEIIDRR